MLTALGLSLEGWAGVAFLLVLGTALGWLAAKVRPETQALREEKEKALSLLRETEVRLERLVEEVKEYAIFQLDAEGRVASWNQGAERLKGWRAQEILGKPNSVFYPEEDVRAGKPKQDLERARAAGSLYQEGWRVRKDGSRFLGGLALTAIHDARGQVTGFIKITRDMTGQRALEARLQALADQLEAQMAARTAALQESETRLQGFIEHAPAAIAFKDPNGKLMRVNRRAEALVGRSLNTLPDQALEDLFPPETVAKIREQDERVLKHREEIQEEETLTFSDGSTRCLLIQKFPLIDTAGRDWGLGVIATDITERKRIERIHLQHQKLESLGLLAGGIAHDFNNLLGGMLGNLEAAQAELGAPAQASEELRTLGELIDRASALVEQIRAFAGKGERQARSIDLNHEVESLCRILRAALAQRAALLWQPAPALPSTEGDPRQIQSVIMNLIFNAAEAVRPPGGTIRLRTGTEYLDQPGLERLYPGQRLVPGAYVFLEVEDNGEGMAPEVQERAFEPFFTTKAAGRGLGLAAVQGILCSHHGGIQVRSQVGKGTCFRLVLLAAPAPVASGPPQAEAATPFRGSGTVLVVDDEPALRKAITSVLHRMGFEILEAADGMGALAGYQASRERIVLVLLDLTMPGMDGEEVYWRLRRAGAMIPIIISSGFSPEEVQWRFRYRGLAGFLRKPYGSKALERTVRDVLAPEVAPQDLAGNLIDDFATWQPEFTTGHPAIDLQHQELVRAFNRVVASLAEPDGDGKALEALQQLIRQARSHFTSEESLMAAAGYSKLAEHHAVHAQLIDQAEDLVGKLQRGELAFSPQTLHFLEDWTLCHMRVEDAQLTGHWQGKETLRTP
jgi:hemerythrin-like metal-binding protein/PAS domain S-box-containing protein